MTVFLLSMNFYCGYFCIELTCVAAKQIEVTVYRIPALRINILEHAV